MSCRWSRAGDSTSFGSSRISVSAGRPGASAEQCRRRLNLGSGSLSVPGPRRVTVNAIMRGRHTTGRRRFADQTTTARAGAVRRQAGGRPPGLINVPLMTRSSPVRSTYAERVVRRGGMRPQAIVRAVPYLSVTCMVAASGSPQVSGLAKRNSVPCLRGSSALRRRHPRGRDRLAHAPIRMRLAEMLHRQAGQEVGHARGVVSGVEDDEDARSPKCQRPMSMRSSTTRRT